MLQHGIDELGCWKDRKNDMNLSIKNENNKILEKKQWDWMDRNQLYDYKCEAYEIAGLIGPCGLKIC
jgi:hypothetical protein